MISPRPSNSKLRKYSKGFSLVELVVGVSVFVVIVISVYGAYQSIFTIIYSSRAKLEAVDLGNEKFEIVRNLPYSDVGISGGIPSGKLAHIETVVRGGSSFEVTTTVRNIDDPFDGTLGGTPNDTAPADFKLVEIVVNCLQCRNFTPLTLTTRVAPKNLEGASTNGALFIEVFDANGNPISGANVHIVNNEVNPPIIIDDVTNVEGMLQVVDTPPGVNAYDITVTKSAYSTDETYEVTVQNPNPTKPRATVALQQVTQVSFNIDKLSTFNVSSVGQTCLAIPSVDFNLKGSKLIGTAPDILKYEQDKTTNGSGILTVSFLEWDSYTFTLTDTLYDLIGINPLSPLNLVPDSSQSVQLVVAAKDSRTLLMIVKDGVTSLPLSGVDVTISKAGFETATSTTGQGFINQTDWSGGSGQATSTDLSKFFSSDGNIENNDPVGDLVLKKVFDQYVGSGILESSSFDTGSESNFQKILWTPLDQPEQSGNPNVRLQIATNNDGGQWNFKGPDGTSGTYYTTANQNIHTGQNNNRYLRYRLFLDTISTSTSPNIGNISFTFTSLCTPPGQVVFSGLEAGTYDLHLEKTGFLSQDISVNVSSSWQMEVVTLMPN